MQANQFSLNLTRKREFKFVPRIINPVKIDRAAIFSADEQARKAFEAVKETMPWVQFEVLKDPISASNFKSKKPAVLIFDDVGMNIVNTEQIKQNNSDAVLVLLSSNPSIHCSPPLVALENFPYTSKADLVFAINKSEFTPENIMPSIVRCEEDKLNIEKY